MIIGSLGKLKAGPPRLSKKALTPQTMASCINKVLDDKTIHERLDQLSVELIEENGVENAVNILLK